MWMIVPIAATIAVLAAAVDAQSPAESAWTAPQARAARALLSSLTTGDRTILPSGIGDEAATGFSAAASVVSRPRAYPLIDVAAYDHLTRCMLVARVDVSKPLPAQVRGEWRAVGQVRPSSDDTVPALAIDGVRSLEAFAADGALVAAPGCSALVEATYGTRTTGDRTALAKLAQHAEIVLRGGAIGSTEAPVEAAAIRQTALSRIRAGNAIERPRYLGSFRGAQHTIVMIGDPRGGTRWAAQYRTLGPTRWQFEGASALGLSLLK